MDLGGAFMGPVLQMQQLANLQQQEQIGALSLQKAQQTAVEQQQFKVMLGELGKQPGTATERLVKAGDAALSMGMLDSADKAYATAALADQRTERALKMKAEAAKLELETFDKKIGQFSSLVQMLPDNEAGWAAVKTAYIAQNKEELTPVELQILNQPWQAGIGNKIQMALLSAKDKAKILYDQGMLGARETEAAAREEHWRRMDAAAKTRADAAARNADAKKKNGGVYAVPTEGQVSMAGTAIRAFLTEQGYEDAVLEQVPRAFQIEIASQARELMKDAQLSWDEAVTQAIEDSQDRLGVSSTGWGWFSSSELKVNPKPAKKMKGAGDEIYTQAEYDKLPVGTVYTFKGKTYRKGSK